MATTESWLQTQETGEVAMSLAIEGVNLVLTTTPDTTGMATAYAGTDWTNVRTGLDIIGTTSQGIDPFQPQIKPDSLTIRVLDTDGSFAQLILGNPSTTKVSRLRSTLEAAQTSVQAPAGTTTGFASSGTIYIGHEAIAYTSLTAASPGNDYDTFGGTVVRGKWSLFGTSTTDRFGRQHTVNRDTPNNRVNSPEIRSVPNAWFHRQVGLVLHHASMNGAGVRTWSTATLPFSGADAKMLWTGRIKNWRDGGDGWIEITCVSIDEALRSGVLEDQYRAEMHDGIILEDKHAGFYFAVGNGTRVATSLDDSVTFTKGVYTYDQVLAIVQKTLADNQPSTQKWSISLQEKDQGPRVVVRMETSAAVGYQAQVVIGFGKSVAQLLGFKKNSTGTYTLDGREVLTFATKGTDSTTDPRTFELIASDPPQLYSAPEALGPGEFSYFQVRRTSGAWVVQPDVPADTSEDAEGYVSVAGRVLAVSHHAAYTVGSTTVEAFLIQYTTTPSDPNAGQIPFSIEDPSPATEVKQVWMERGKAGEILLRLLLSTGSAGYNHATYDVYTGGMGLGIPCDLIDVDSFLDLDVQYELLLDKPTSFGSILEEVLAVYNRHLIFEDGRLRLTPSGFDSPFADDIVELDETTKADPYARTTAEYGADGIINRLRLDYSTSSITNRPNFTQTGDFSFVDFGRQAQSLTIADTASESDFGHRRELAMQARGILEPWQWAQHVADPVIRYFARPFGTLRRSINPRMFHVVPGRICRLTDNALIDPTTGRRGVSGLACWVRHVEINWRDMTGSVEMVFLPTHAASRYGQWAPSALVDHAADTSGFTNGYSSGTGYVQLIPKTYGRTTDPSDVSFFAVGDAVQVVELSAVSPERSTATIDFVDTSTTQIRLASLSGTVTWAAAKRYVVEPRDYGNAVTAQRDDSFIADDAGSDLTALDGLAPAKLWSGPYRGSIGVRANPDYSQEFVRPATLDSADGEPLSSRKYQHLVKNCNSLLSYGTRNCLVNETGLIMATTANAYTLMCAPIWVPLYGITSTDAYRRQLLGKVRLAVSGVGTASVRVVSSSAFVRGTGTGSSQFSYPGATSAQTATHSTTTATWVDVAPFNPVIMFLNGQFGTYITAELKGSGAITSTCTGFALVEAAI